MKKRVFTIISVIILITCSFQCPILALDEPNNITNTTNVINTNDINQLQMLHNETENGVTQVNEQLENVRSQLSETMLQIQELDEKIESYEKEIDTLSLQAGDLKESIEELEQKLIIAQENYEKQKELLQTRLTVLYETGETSFLDVLLESKSIADFVSKYYIISQIVDYDNQLLEQTEIEKIQIEVAKNTLEEKRKLYKVAKDNAEKTAISLENIKIVKNNYINKLTDEEKALQEKIDIYNQQVREIETLILMYAKANIGTDYVGGSFMWPVPGYTRITSPFGMRVHPITNVYKLHTGTDIGAPTGTNFLAMNSGTVIKAGWNDAYGNMVIIDHGGGVVTLYAHGSEIMVTLGQQVNKGDVVLKVGETGYATGPHAHFEIRINGEYMDPMQFVRPD